MTHINITHVEDAVLEHLIDTHGLAEILYYIAEICAAKADHIFQSSYATTRATDPDARLWAHHARAVAAAAGKVRI